MKPKIYALITIFTLLINSLACGLVTDLLPEDETPLPADVLFRDDFSDPPAAGTGPTVKTASPITRMAITASWSTPPIPMCGPTPA